MLLSTFFFPKLPPRVKYFLFKSYVLKFIFCSRAGQPISKKAALYYNPHVNIIKSVLNKLIIIAFSFWLSFNTMEKSNLDKKWLKEAHLLLMNLITKNRWDLDQQ